MRAIVAEAFFQNRLDRLKSSTLSVGDKSAAYDATQDVPLLNAALDHSFDAVADATALGPGHIDSDGSDWASGRKSP
jgi:hypothetical protein